MRHLVEDHSAVDPKYVEDFLLTYRTFLDSPLCVADKMVEWFADPSLRDKVSCMYQPTRCLAKTLHSSVSNSYCFWGKS